MLSGQLDLCEIAYSQKLEGRVPSNMSRPTATTGDVDLTPVALLLAMHQLSWFSTVEEPSGAILNHRWQSSVGLFGLLFYIKPWETWAEYVLNHRTIHQIRSIRGFSCSGAHTFQVRLCNLIRHRIDLLSNTPGIDGLDL